MMNEKVTIKGISRYLVDYIKVYREQYKLFVAPVPDGGGYPLLEISPYLYSKNVFCYVGKNGYAIADYSLSPTYEWHIAGGPAMISDYPDPNSKIPEWVTQILSANFSNNAFIGLYRVCNDPIPFNVWKGNLDDFIKQKTVKLEDTIITIYQYDLLLEELMQRFTYGVLGLTLDIVAPKSSDMFWNPSIIHYLGFLPADRSSRKFFNYLEYSSHLDLAAWDIRSIPVRAHTDIRRDFGRAFTVNNNGVGGYFSFGLSLTKANFHDRLTLLQKTIKAFEELLDVQGNDENAIHQFLETHPILLSVYGESVSKPRFTYPAGESPIGKAYVEPDFVFKLPGQSYLLIELERATKNIATQQGQPRSEVSQAAFQIAEWRTYIQNHYEIIKNEFPGISVRNQFKIVISRDTVGSFGDGRDIIKYKELLKNQYNVNDVLTYDDLLAQANDAYIRLASLYQVN